MNVRKRTGYVTSRDGTRIAWHSYVDPETESTVASLPPLLLTNGLGTSENFWRHLVTLFARDHRVTHWDYRGHGRSESAAGGDYRLETHADDLARVTEAVIASGDGRTVPVQVAFSMGVPVLLELYRTRPDLVRAMVLVGGPSDAPYADTFPMRLPGVLPALRALVCLTTPIATATAPLFHRLATSRIAYPAARALGIVRRTAPRDDIETFTKTMAEMDPRAFWLSLHALLGAHAGDVLPTITVPVLIVAASHDLFVPRSQMEALGAAIRSPHQTVIEDSGHAVLIESGPQVCAAIRLFLRDEGLSRAAGGAAA